jgi:hypothetical protein
MSIIEGADDAMEAVADHMPTGMLDDSNVRDALRNLFAIAAYPTGLPPSVVALVGREPELISGAPSAPAVAGGVTPDAEEVSRAGKGWVGPLAAVDIGDSTMSPEQKVGRDCDGEISSDRFRSSSRE